MGPSPFNPSDASNAARRALRSAADKDAEDDDADAGVLPVLKSPDPAEESTHATARTRQNPAATPGSAGLPVLRPEGPAPFCNEQSEDEAGYGNDEGEGGGEEGGKRRARRAERMVERRYTGKDCDEDKNDQRDGEGKEGAEEGAENGRMHQLQGRSPAPVFYPFRLMMSPRVDSTAALRAISWPVYP